MKLSKSIVHLDCTNNICICIYLYICFFHFKIIGIKKECFSQTNYELISMAQEKVF